MSAARRRPRPRPVLRGAALPLTRPRGLAAAAAAVLVLCALCASPASAGAWTRAPGSVFASAGSSWYESGGDYPYEEVVGATYGEIGVLPWLTLGGAVEHKQPLGENTFLGDQTRVAGFARFRLREGAAGDPLSAQLLFDKPLDDQEGERPSRRNEEASMEARLLYGRGFGTPLGAGFVDIGLAYRANLDASSDQIRLDATAGLRPLPRLLVMLQSFNTFGLGNEELAGDRLGADYDVHKIAPSIGYEFGAATALIGYEREIGGRNLGALGERWRFAIWREFSF